MGSKNFLTLRSKVIKLIYSSLIAIISEKNMEIQQSSISRIIFLISTHAGRYITPVTHTEHIFMLYNMGINLSTNIIAQSDQRRVLYLFVEIFFIRSIIWLWCFSIVIPIRNRLSSPILYIMFTSFSGFFVFFKLYWAWMRR